MTDAEGPKSEHERRRVDDARLSSQFPIYGNDAFLQMAEYTGDLIGICDTDGRLLYLNPAGRRMIGIDDADIFPLQLTDYVAAEQRQLVIDEIVPTARRHGVWQGEMQLEHRRTGTRIDVERSTFANQSLDGELRGFVSLMRDVTERKRRVDELERQTELFRSLIARNPFGVYLVDADFRLQVISRGAAEVFEAVPGAIGSDFASVTRTIWPEPLASEIIARFRHTLATGEPFESAKTEDVRADSAVRESYHWRIERTPMPDGRDGIVCYFYELTEAETLRRTILAREAELRQAARELEERVRQRTSALHLAHEQLAAEADRREALQAAHAHGQKLEAIGQLTAGIAHDFNNILGALVGGLTIIEGRISDRRVQQVVQMSKAAAERGASMVRQLMDFARHEELNPSLVDVGSLLLEVVEFVTQTHSNAFEIVADIPVDLSSAMVDRAQLQSALLNLANNACDAMPDGGKLLLRARNSKAEEEDAPLELLGEDAVLIEIIDSGTGMDGATLQRITEPFFTTKERGRGTGLGLAMVQRFVAHSRGALRIASQVGKGSTFGIYLPRGDGPAGRNGTGEGGERGGIEQGFEAVLLVDDSDELREILAAGLVERGFEVTTARSGEDALALCRSRRFDVLVSDVDLPGINGGELVEKLRAEGMSLPCLYMTGGAAPAAEELHPILRKPFGADELHRAIRHLLVGQGRQTAAEDKLNRLALRLQSDCARSLFGHWRAIGGGQGLPSFANFRLDACSEPHRLVIAQVDLGRVPVAFNFELIGDTLRADMPGPITTKDLPVTGNDTPAAREAAYRRCALTGRPSFEYARFDLGETDIETFERLLLPFSSDGKIVDRIVGAVVIERQSREGDHERTD